MPLLPPTSPKRPEIRQNPVGNAEIEAIYYSKGRVFYGSAIKLYYNLKVE